MNPQRSDPNYWLEIAEEDYRRGVRLTTERRLAEADEALRWAVAMFDVLAGIDDDPTWKLDLQRRLSLAYWRQSLVSQLEGRLEEGLTRAREGITVALSRLDQLEAGTDEHSETTAHAATMMVDAAAMIEADQAEERLVLLDEAVRRCGDDPHPCVKDARASALHNQANAMLLALCHDPNRPSGGELRRSLERIAHIAAEAISLRMDLTVEPEPGAEPDRLASWELACSLLLGSQVLMYCTEHTAAAELLGLAYKRIDMLGPHGYDLDRKARKLVKAMTRRAPEAMAAAREEGYFTSLAVPA